MTLTIFVWGVTDEVECDRIIVGNYMKFVKEVRAKSVRRLNLKLKFRRPFARVFVYESLQLAFGEDVILRSVENANGPATDQHVQVIIFVENFNHGLTA